MADFANDKVLNNHMKLSNSKTREGKSTLEDAPQSSEEYNEFIGVLLRKMNESEKLKKNFAKQGAIPKKWNHEESNRQRNQYKYYKNNRKNDNTVSENGKKKMEVIKRPDVRQFSSAVSLKTENNRSSFVKNYHQFPFYYVIPENPSLINLLRPGTYLVIPQNKISHFPLQVIRHPTANENEMSDGNSVNKAVRRDKTEDSNESQNTEENGEEKFQQTTKQGGSVSPEGERTDQTAKACVETLQGESEEILTESNESRTYDSEEHLGDSKRKLSDYQLATLLTELPYFGENYLLREWKKKEQGQTFDQFVQELRDRRKNEVYATVLNKVPNISPGLLQKKISQILDSDEAVLNFIEKENLKVSEDLKKLKETFVEYEDEEIVTAYHKLKDEFQDLDLEDLELFRVIRNELKTKRKEEEKMLQLQIIFNMLPDVDADYVMTKLNDINGNSTLLNNFVEELLEVSDYPKAAEFDPISREKQKLWNYYVSNYSPDSYLKKVPDPEQFFSGSSVRDHKINRECAIKFLEFRYPDLDNFQLNEIFTNSDESILKTCRILDKNYLPEISIDESLKSSSLTEAFMQEVTYITRKDEILNRLREVNELRLLEILRAEEENAFFECLVCYDSTVIPSEAVVCPEGHISCKNCLVTYAEMLFAEGKYLFPCLSGTCDTEYTMKTLEKSLDSKLFSKIAQRRAAEDIDKAGVPGLEKCPSCDFAFIPAPEDKVFRCLNDDCLRVTCRLCKEDNHIPLSCKEVERPKDLLARQQVEEAMTKRLVRSCPQCFKKFIKIDGCNKISCPCGVILCYVCSQIVEDYTHFNGMGGAEFHKCPLFSENRKLHVVDVLEAGVEEKERIKRADPNVNFVFDPTESMKDSL